MLKSIFLILFVFCGCLAQAQQRRFVRPQPRPLLKELQLTPRQRQQIQELIRQERLQQLLNNQRLQDILTPAQRQRLLRYNQQHNLMDSLNVKKQP